jgi:hypothetical protein
LFSTIRRQNRYDNAIMTSMSRFRRKVDERGVWFIALLLLGGSSAHAGKVPPGRVLLDVDLTKGRAGPGRVEGGRWERGWRVTDHGQRIVWDAGYPIRNGRLEAWFTMDRDPLSPTGARGQWLGMHGQSNLTLKPQYLQLRGGRSNYGFSKLRVKGEGSVRCEIKGGALEQWRADDKTVMRVVLEWKDGVPVYVDPAGTAHACTEYHKATGPIVVSALRWAFIGSDNSEQGAALPGMRFLRVRLTDLRPETGRRAAGR